MAVLWDTFPLVGRRDELTSLRSLLESVSKGRGGFALLSGELGAGKTRLLEEIAAEAPAHGIEVVWGRPYGGDGAQPLWPWRQILRSLVRTRGPCIVRAGAPDLLADGAVLAPDLIPLLAAPSAPPPDPHTDHFRVYTGVTEILTAAATCGPLLLLLDDLHTADAPSLALLESLARGLESMPVALVGAYRDGAVPPDHPLAGLLPRLRRSAGTHHVAVHGLDRVSTAAALALARPDATPAELDDLAGSLHAYTDGNPLFLIETLRDLVGSGQLGNSGGESGGIVAEISGGLPAGIAGVLAEQLDRLTEECREALAVASVVGATFDLAILAGVLGTGGVALLDALEEAVRSRVILAERGVPPRYRFAHAIMRQAVYDRLGGGERARLHWRVAGALQAAGSGGTGVRGAEIAWHSARGAPAGDAGVALGRAERAADEAMRRAAYADAVAMYELAIGVMALQVPVDTGHCSVLLLRLADALARTGDYRRANDNFARAAEMVQGGSSGPGASGHHAARLMARAAIGYGRQWLRNDTVDREHIALLEEALAALPEEDLALRAEVLARMAGALRDVEAPERRRALAERAQALARASGDPEALEGALWARRATLYGLPHRAERLSVTDAARQLGQRRRDQDLAPDIRAIVDALEVGDVAEVDRELDRIEQAARAAHQPYAEWQVAALRAMRATLGGRLEEAEALARTARDLGRRMPGNPSGDVYASQVFFLRAEQGRHAELITAMAVTVARDPENGFPRFLLEFLRVSSGEFSTIRKTVERLEASGWFDVRRGEALPVHLSMLAEIYAAVPDLPHGEQVYEMLRPFAGSLVIDGAGIVCRGAAAHYLGLLAAALARNPATPPDEARALRAEALRYLDDACAVHGAIGAALYAARSASARAALLAAREHTPEPAPKEESAGFMARAGLTRREGEVLRLVAAGRSNREIAEHFVLSVRTVERHIANIYHKIGVRNKAEATSFAVRHNIA